MNRPNRGTCYCLLLTLTCAVGCAATLPSASAESAPGASASELMEQARDALWGRGTDRNPELAMRLMSEASEMGHPDAVGGLGYFYDRGIVVEKDPKMAAERYLAGAKMGSARSAFNLGNMLLAGRGVPRDEEAGSAWIQWAASEGLPESIEKAGLLYLHGEGGVPKDWDISFAYLSPARDELTPIGINALGFLYANHTDEEGHIEKAKELYEAAARAGEPRAAGNLGALLMHGAKDQEAKEEAITWLMVGEASGDVGSKKMLADFSAQLAPDEYERLKKAANAIGQDIRIRASIRRIQSAAGVKPTYEPTK